MISGGYYLKGTEFGIIITMLICVLYIIFITKSIVAYRKEGRVKKIDVVLLIIYTLVVLMQLSFVTGL